MKSTGVVRKLDELGRIVIPMELRKNLGLKEKSPLEIFTEGESIVLKSYRPGCVFCNESSELITFEGKKICRECLDRIQKKY